MGYKHFSLSTEKFFPSSILIISLDSHAKPVFLNSLLYCKPRRPHCKLWGSVCYCLGRPLAALCLVLEPLPFWDNQGKTGKPRQNKIRENRINLYGFMFLDFVLWRVVECVLKVKSILIPLQESVTEWPNFHSNDEHGLFSSQLWQQ